VVELHAGKTVWRQAAMGLPPVAVSSLVLSRGGRVRVMELAGLNVAAPGTRAELHVSVGVAKALKRRGFPEGEPAKGLTPRSPEVHYKAVRFYRG
jgi:hypothetical protein